MQSSAYQVRLGGAKGVLVSKADLAPEGVRKVELRKSQVKFTSEDYFLEVIRCATFS